MAGARLRPTQPLVGRAPGVQIVKLGPELRVGTLPTAPLKEGLGLG